MILNYLPIDKDMIKYRPEVFEMNIKGVLYTFRFSYNTYDSRFYASIYRTSDKKPIIEGKKVTYGVDLLSGFYNDAKPEDIVLIPVDFSSEPVEEVTEESFMDSVYVYIIDGDIDE